jgi:exodeoxyribonuclease-1
VSAPGFFFHDYETFGTDPRRDAPAQFAGQRADLNLNPVGEPVVAFCKPPRDALPKIEACLITGLTPQHCEREGLPEAEFAAMVHGALSEPATCGVGYNSIRFDDEVTRHLLYRNFFDPYAREWEHGNSRWDVIELARLCYALRPEGVIWPPGIERPVSFALADLSAANRLSHDRAHDALSDVEATLALARLLRRAQPRLFDWYLGLRDKRKALSLLDWAKMSPVLHVSSRYRAERGCLAMVAPIAPLPDQANAVIVYDLSEDPRDLIERDADEVRERVFTARTDLPEDTPRIALKLVRANRAPALAPLSTLAGVDLARIQLDPERCERHRQQLLHAPDLAEKVRQVFATPQPSSTAEDPDVALYSGGFISDADRALARRVRGTPPADLAALHPRFRDARYTELYFRYRARNWPQLLDTEEAGRWRAHCAKRLGDLDAYPADIMAQRHRPDIRGGDHAILDALESWAHQLLIEANT